MSKRHHRPELPKSPHGARLRHIALFVVFTAALLASGFVWIIPVEVVQQWAFDRAGIGNLRPIRSGWCCRVFNLDVARRFGDAADFDLVSLV